MEDNSSHHSIDKLSEKKFSTPFKNEENTQTQNNESEHVLVSSDNILNCSSTDSSSSSDTCDANIVKDIDKLDVLSKNFDPLSALYCKEITKIKNVVVNAPVLDNVATFEALYNKKNSSNKDARHTTETKKGELLAKSDIDYSSARNFTPDQMPVAGTKKELNNVIKFMKKQANGIGPISNLQKCIETGRRIKVVIRGNFNNRQ